MITENKNTVYYNLWNKVNAMLRKKFIAINTDIKGEKMAASLQDGPQKKKRRKKISN